MTQEPNAEHAVLCSWAFVQIEEGVRVSALLHSFRKMLMGFGHDSEV